MLRCLLLLVILAVFPVAAFPGPQAAAPDLGFSGESSVSWVLVPVVVRGSSGHARNLDFEDFRLQVDGDAVSIMSFEAEPDAPIRLIYLQDLSGSMAIGGKLEASREALRCFLRQARSGDEYALVTFASGETRFEVPFTAETALLEQALAAWRGHGTTALHDAVARLPEVRAGDRALKQAAVLATDGGDNASTIDPRRAREILRAAELPVYVLDLRTHQEPRAAPRPESFAHLLRLLASATGGRYSAVRNDSRSRQGRGREGGTHDMMWKDSVGEACAEITQDLRYQYVLGFQTRDTGKPAYREIHVEIDSKKTLRLSHRRGYLGLSPLGTPSDNP